MKDKEQLFSLVALAIQDVIVVEGVHLHLRNKVNHELFWLVLEEFDGFNDLAMSFLDNIVFQGWGEFSK